MGDLDGDWRRWLGARGNGEEEKDGLSNGRWEFLDPVPNKKQSGLKLHPIELPNQEAVVGLDWWVVVLAC